MKKLLVLRGGPSSEHEVSLKTGRSIINALKDNYNVKDVVIGKDGVWIDSGLEVKPDMILRNVDCVINAMHGEYGEDGEVQRLLERSRVPFTGPKTLAAKLSMNKVSAKDIFKKHGLLTPLHVVVNRTWNVEELAFGLFRSFPMPVVIKPVALGSSVGVSIARDFKSLVETLTSLFLLYDKLLIEEYIAGKEATVGVVERFRNKDVYPFLPIEIKPKTTFFDYEAKYSGETEEICPGLFSRKESEEMQEAAILAHTALGLRHYSRSDFILHPRRGLYILETNSLPGLTNESLLPKSFEPIGWNYYDFLEHVIDLAINDK